MKDIILIEAGEEAEKEIRRELLQMIEEKIANIRPEDDWYSEPEMP